MPDVIDRLYELYVIQNHHYLLQFRGGFYCTVTERAKPLRRYQMDAHINGRTTVGTFSGQHFTKFLTFDVDFKHSLELAKWVTYKLAAALDSVGAHEYAISYSGNKGYHVDLFFDMAIPVETARTFFAFIVSLAEVSGVEGGEVEFRPSAQQGVKLPIGTHQKTGNFCGFCRIEDGLRVMNREESTAYLHAINKTDHTLIISRDDMAHDLDDAAEMENVIARHTPLETYAQDESYSLTRAAERYHNGLTGPGQRHNSFLLLARLFNHNGVDRAGAVESITEWLAWQESGFYESSAEYCAEDLRKCVDYVYDKNLTLNGGQRDLTVSFCEIDDIIRRCPQKSHKALAYALLIHSKRWASASGTFFMVFNQMAEASGLCLRTAKTQINQLENIGVIEIVKRDQKVRGTFKKKPNIYRMTLAAGGEEYEVTKETGLADCLHHFYEDSDLKDALPRRQYEALTMAS
ncbi:TOTE conflict system archaeo-eukaryotic primase domain-containing protein [Paenibacillus wynnii]|uniref:TOTE conflict system primase domain-containing protein n=1 Tax=Paenibacillus wynnii TaxID=268407 RepID=A0A098MFI8_9BACL|nr:hypothetical protein [Paenibacillus wynnii]KGE20806.1 hypothetical protein PWYN_01090 [Paenibacillus wynnii]